MWPCLFVPGGSSRLLLFPTARWLSTCPIELHQSPRSLGSWPGVVPELGVRAQPRFSLSTRGSLVDRAPLPLVPSLGPGCTHPHPLSRAGTVISYYEFNEAKARIPFTYYHNGVIPPNLPRPRNIEPVFRCIPRRVDARGRAEYE